METFQREKNRCIRPTSTVNRKTILNLLRVHKVWLKNHRQFDTIVYIYSITTHMYVRRVLLVAYFYHATLCIFVFYTIFTHVMSFVRKTREHSTARHSCGALYSTAVIFSAFTIGRLLHIYRSSLVIYVLLSRRYCHCVYTYLLLLQFELGEIYFVLEMNRRVLICVYKPPPSRACKT